MSEGSPFVRAQDRDVCKPFRKAAKGQGGKREQKATGRLEKYKEMVTQY